MTIERTSRVVWEGDLIRGSGNIEFTTGALPATPVTWASRTEQPDGKTSPEELLAAAHASCFSMALSAALARSKHPPRKLNVEARCSLNKLDEGFRVTDMYLKVQGEVEGIKEEDFIKIAESAEKSCPISNAIKNNVAIHLEARLKA